MNLCPAMLRSGPEPGANCKHRAAARESPAANIETEAEVSTSPLLISKATPNLL